MIVMIKNTMGLIALLGLSFLLVIGETKASEGVIKPYDCNAMENRDIKTTIDMKLAKRWKKEKKEIKKRLAASDSTLKVRLSFFPFLDPPINLGVGKCVSAERGRLAIEKAIEYNKGVGFLVRQEILPHHWVRIGLTDLSELAWIAVGPEDLARLSDPNLTTDQFQALYREMATLKERKLPFGLGTKEIEVMPEE
ncbi:hypothetical protein JYT92_00075 [bacterium AH-315-L15]|nr:hypothetical protein [bacterium AH-315-L15]